MFVSELLQLTQTVCKLTASLFCTRCVERGITQRLPQRLVTSSKWWIALNRATQTSSTNLQKFSVVWSVTIMLIILFVNHLNCLLLFSFHMFGYRADAVVRFCNRHTICKSEPCPSKITTPITSPSSASSCCCRIERVTQSSASVTPWSWTRRASTRWQVSSAASCSKVTWRTRHSSWSSSTRSNKTSDDLQYDVTHSLPRFHRLLCFNRVCFQELSYLSGLLAVKKLQGPDKALRFYNEAVETHFAGLKVGQIIISLPRNNADLSRSDIE